MQARCIGAETMQLYNKEGGGELTFGRLEQSMYDLSVRLVRGYKCQLAYS